jgi:flagellar hook-associated protein 3 FlgL
MTMRISTSETAQTALNGILTSYDRFSIAEQKVSTGKQLNVPSDNPAGTAQVLDLNEQMSELDQYDSIINQATTFASTSADALTSVTTLVQQARTIGVQAANGISDTTTYAALTSQLQNIINQVGQIGNTSDGDQYVFAGQRSNTPPFVANGSGYNYVGGSTTTGDGNINLTIGRGETITVNVTGDSVLVPVLNALTTLKNDVSNGAAQSVTQNDLSALDTQLNNLEGAQANLGSLVDRLNQSTQRNALTKQNFTQFVSNIQDADIPSTVVELQTAQTAYQAALQATTKVFQYSLLNFIQ